MWREGAILLVAGRVDHRGEEAIAARGCGRGTGTRPRSAGRRRSRARSGSVERRARRTGSTGTARQRRTGPTGGYGARSGRADRPDGAGRRCARRAGAGRCRRVSPLRASAADARRRRMRAAAAAPIATARSRRTSLRRSLARGRRRGARRAAAPRRGARRRGAPPSAPRRPVEAGRRGPQRAVLRDAGPDRVVSAMQAFKAVLRERPGGDPGRRPRARRPAGRRCRWSSAGVAYDAELLAEVRRRVGEGIVDLALG